jgi:hypothetical protein
MDPAHLALVIAGGIGLLTLGCLLLLPELFAGRASADSAAGAEATEPALVVRTLLSSIAVVGSTAFPSRHQGGTEGSREPDPSHHTVKPEPTRPSGDPGDPTPRGRPQEVRPQDNGQTRRILTRANESAGHLAAHGYVIEQQPGARAAAGNDPDYLIEGRVFDHYAPSTERARTIWSVAQDLVEEGQATRIILNLDDSAVDLDALRRQFVDRPVSGLDEVIVLRDGVFVPFSL